MWKRSGRTYCSDECRDAWVARSSSERLSETNRRHASERMKARNPMRDAETRKKMSDTLKRIGHQPPVRGGNGYGLTEPQRKLAEALGWPTEVPIAVGDGEMPSAYSADIAHPTMKVLIEVDGGSHFSLERRASDRRRDARLASIGWLTFRFSNRDAMGLTQECVATVLSTTSKWQERTPTS